MSGVPAPGGLRPLPFRDRVLRSFGRRASDYDRNALLQRAVAWRLARLCRDLGLPSGPVADLGAGSGLLSRYLLEHRCDLRQRPPLQLDLCRELLDVNPLVDRTQAAGGEGGSAAQAQGLIWDLNRGLPASLRQASLLVSSFALQWLEAPPSQLHHWCLRLRSGGWLALAVPTSGSLPQWRRAAIEADVPCTALDLPGADALLTAVGAADLTICRHQRLRFTRPRQGGLRTLRQLHRLGAGCSRQAPLGPSQLRRLLACWPPESPLTWEVLLLIGRRN